MGIERKVKCDCGYEWITKSKLSMVTCPSCQNKTKVSKVSKEKK